YGRCCRGGQRGASAGGASAATAWGLHVKSLAAKAPPTKPEAKPEARSQARSPRPEAKSEAKLKARGKAQSPKPGARPKAQSRTLPKLKHQNRERSQNGAALSKRRRSPVRGWVSTSRLACRHRRSWAARASSWAYSRSPSSG